MNLFEILHDLLQRLSFDDIFVEAYLPLVARPVVHHSDRVLGLWLRWVDYQIKGFGKCLQASSRPLPYFNH